MKKNITLATIALALIATAGSSYGADCEALVSEGRAFLASSNILSANERFATAVAQCPDHEVANFFRAVTRVASWPLQPAASNLLTRLGVPTEGRSIYNWTALPPQDDNGAFLAPAGVNAKEAASLIRTNLLVEILGAQQNLARIGDPNFQLTLSAAETMTEDVTIDAGDIQVIRALLHAGEFAAYTIYSWNLDVQLSALRQLYENGLLSIERVLADNPRLLTFETAADFFASKQAFSNAVDRYVAGSDFIRGRPPVVRLFNVDPEDQPKEESFRCGLLSLRDSLERSVVLCADDRFTVNLGNYYSGSHSLRSFLPRFWRNHPLAGTWPDNSFGGVVGGLPGELLDSALAAHFGARTVMTGGRLWQADSFLCEFSTIRGQVYILEASDDLAIWTELTRFESEGGIYGFIDGGAREHGHRYYRLLDLELAYVSTEGQVIDKCSGLPVAGALIGTTLDEQTTTTDPNGHFFLKTRSLPQGEFYTRVSKQGYFSDDFYHCCDGAAQGQKFWLWPVSPVPPPNDNFADRIAIVGLDVKVSGQNCNTIGEENDPISYIAWDNVWYKWTSPVTAEVWIEAFGIEGQPKTIVVCVGNSLAELREMTVSYGSLYFSAEAGVEYQIAIADGSTGHFEARIYAPPTVQIVSPPEKAEFTDPVDIPISVTASDPDGTVKEVRLYAEDESRLLVVLTNSPYEWVWHNPPLGGHQLLAAAFDTQGNRSWTAYCNFQVRPANDDFANRIPITGMNVRVSGSTQAATIEAGEIDLGYQNDSVWWTWTAPSNTTVTITAYGPFPASYSPQLLGIFTGNSLTELQTVALSTAWSSGLGCILSNYVQATFSATAGTHYQIMLGGGMWGGGGNDVDFQIRTGTPPTVNIDTPLNGANFTIGSVENVSVSATDIDGDLARVDLFNGCDHLGTRTAMPYTFVTTNTFGGPQAIMAAATDRNGLTTFSSPVTLQVGQANDDFANRAALSGSSVAATGATMWATYEPGEPFHGGYGGISVWWTWTAPQDGVVRLTVNSENYWTLLAVYQGLQLNALSQIAWANWESMSFGATLTMTVTAGAQYQIAVADAYSGIGGAIALHINYE